MLIPNLRYDAMKDIKPGSIIVVNYTGELIFGMVGVLKQNAGDEIRMFVLLERARINLFGGYGFVQLSQLQVFHAYVVPKAVYVPDLSHESTAFQRPQTLTLVLRGEEQFIQPLGDRFPYFFDTKTGYASDQEVTRAAQFLNWQVRTDYSANSLLLVDNK